MGRYVNEKQKGAGKKLLKFALIFVLILSIGVAGVLIAARMLLVYPGGEPLLRSSEEADLRHLDITAEEYYALAEEMPQCRILWNIPIGGSTYDSTAASITLETLSEADIPLFSCFENLQTVDAPNCEDYEALLKLEAALPGCTVNWSVHLGGEGHPRDVTALDLQGTGLTCGELLEKLPYFPNLQQADLTGLSLTTDDQTALREAFPHVSFTWNMEVCGKTWSNADTHLPYAGEKVDVSALIAAAPQFPAVEELDMTGCGCTLEELTALQEAFGGAFVRGEVTLFGKTFSTDAEELDFSGIQMEDTAQLEQAVSLMPNLKKVIMCDCGFSNEEMDALNKRHENVLFVWTVKFSVYTLRTDATAFCASNLPSNGYIAIKMTDADLEPLKYCTELVALDLGHMYYTDLSFLENMPKLQYLILVEARYQDISAIASLKELYYLELFNNTIEDLSPLLECKNLRHLNVGFTRGYDASVLEQMTWLERLWYPGNSLSAEQKEAITAALTDTQVYMPSWDSDGSTGGGWREGDVYQKMRDFFGMFYQPGGTGTDNLKNG